MRLRTIGLISTLALGLLAAPLPTEAQEPTKVPRIGYLSVRGPDREKRRLAAFHQGLRELGYIEGQNLVIEYRYAEGQSVDARGSLGSFEGAFSAMSREHTV